MFLISPILSYFAVPLSTLLALSLLYRCRDQWGSKQAHDPDLPSSNNFISTLRSPTTAFQDDDVCPLCHEELKEITAPILQLPRCRHIYCRTCLEALLDRGMNTCVICRDIFCCPRAPPEFHHSVLRWNFVLFNAGVCILYEPVFMLRVAFAGDEGQDQPPIWKFSLGIGYFVAYAMIHVVNLLIISEERSNDPDDWWLRLYARWEEVKTRESIWAAVSLFTSIWMLVDAQAMLWRFMNEESIV
ncbi:hypothetical protein AUEXF2481DRAFT_30091 [Lecanosticta acicola]|uniref:RING-type domain-containing protein n=1 Tax=Lecanosticta acicola TaxID=111012 RepID=A0AAI8YPH4_9PEZI|nr:hypothetical protein AUEXF2481DRAFT_30091 [Lecanosticta acicola]